PDGADQERPGDPGARRDDDLQPRRVGVVRLLALRVMLEGADAAAVGHADDHLDVVAPAGAGAVAGRVVLDLVEGLEGEAGELDLGDGLEAVDRHADRHPDDRALRQGRVDDPLLAELLEEPLGDAEASLVDADVLAEHHDVVVPLHLLVEREVDRLDHRQLAARFRRHPRLLFATSCNLPPTFETSRPPPPPPPTGGRGGGTLSGPALRAPPAPRSPGP